MKKIFHLFLLALLFLNCSSDDTRIRNSYLPNYGVNLEINLNLPLYNNLNYPNNAIFISQGNSGINGIILVNAAGSFLAFEATCPNQIPSTCSKMEIQGMSAVCPCDNVVYSLYTGQPNANLQFGLLQYRTEVNGNVIRVYN